MYSSVVACAIVTVRLTVCVGIVQSPETEASPIIKKLFEARRAPLSPIQPGSAQHIGASSSSHQSSPMVCITLCFTNLLVHAVSVL